MRDNGSGNNYRHNSRNQNQHNSYNNTRYNNKNANQNMSMHNSAYSNIMNKDLAPRFKRNLMTSSQAPVEELQMRPTANSLLYKTQSISVSKISFSNGNPQQNIQHQPHSNNRKITNGQPNDNPTYYGGGGGNVNDGNFNNQQHQPQFGHSSPITATGNNNNNGNNNMPPIQQQQQQLQNFASDMGTPSLAQKSNTPINNILNKDQVAIKHSAATDKATKQKNKDKGPSKDDVLKTVATFISDFLLMDNAQKSTLKTSAGTSDKHFEQDPAPYAQILVEAFVQLNVPDKFMKDAIVKILNETLDKAADVHDTVINFLLQLRKSNQKLTNHITLESFKSLINGMNEKEKSIPKVTTLVSLLLTKAVTVKLCKLVDIANHSENGQHYPLLLLILQQLNKTLGKQALIELFNASRINLLATLPESDRTKDRMAEILEDRQLSFLYPLLRVQSELWKQLQFDPHPQQFYKWIKENIDLVCYNDPSFITALMTVLVKYVTQVGFMFIIKKIANINFFQESTLTDGTDKTKVPDKSTIEKEKQLLQKFCPILINYLNGNVDLQMTAIYALQVFCYGADFPKGDYDFLIQKSTA
jgi:translation initiation factor 4G